MANSDSDGVTTNATEQADEGRRGLMALALGLFGAGALAACSGGENEPIGMSSAAATGLAGDIVVTWVDTVLGSNFPTNRLLGDLATKTSTNLDSSGKKVIAIAKGCLSPGDGGGGVFYWSTGGTPLDDGGTIIVPGGAIGSSGTNGCWVRIFSDHLNVRWFGARGDAYTGQASPNDDTVAVLNAIAAASGATMHGTVFFPGGIYLISTSLNIPGGVSLQGDGNQGFGGWAVLRYTGQGTFLQLRASPIEGGNKIRDIRIARDGQDGGDAIFIEAWGTQRPSDIVIHNVLVDSAGAYTTPLPDGGTTAHVKRKFARALHIDGTAFNTVGSRGVRSVYLSKFRGAECLVVNGDSETILLVQVTHIIGSLVQCDAGDAGYACLKIVGGYSDNVQIHGLYCDRLILSDTHNAKFVGHVNTSVSVDGACRGVDLVMDAGPHNGLLPTTALSIANGATGSAHGTYDSVDNASAGFRVIGHRFDGTATFGIIPAGQCQELTMTVPSPNGIYPGVAIVPVWPGGLPAGIIGTMFVKAYNTVLVRLANVSSAPVNVGAIGSNFGFTTAG